MKNEENIHLLKEFIVYLNALKKPLKTPQDAEIEIATFADFHGIKAKNLFMPLRYAMLGSSGGVGIAPLIVALGIEETKRRITKALESLEK